MDLFVVPTIGFNLLYAFVIIGLGRRALVWVNVTTNPTAEWIARQITEAFPWGEAPKYLIRDRDRIYGATVTRRLQTMGIRDRPIAPAALALACKPQLLIADEPTTGLDVTTQKAAMDLAVELTRERGMSMILITHDLGLAAAYCDRVVVMEKGHVVETANSETIFKAPSHRYTRKLMRATPRPGVTLRDLLPEDEAKSAQPVAKSNGNGHAGPPLLLVEKLVKEYPCNDAGGTLKKLFGPKPAVKPDNFKAVDGISFSVARGESVGLVGELGCGKSTTSMMVMRLIDKTSGLIQFDRQDIGEIPARKFATLSLRKRIQMVFQDPTTASIRATPPRAPSPIRSCASATANAPMCASAARNWRGRSACRSNCLTASRISFLAGRRPASALRGLSPSSPTSSSSTSRPRRSTSRSRPWFLICCRT